MCGGVNKHRFFVPVRDFGPSASNLSGRGGELCHGFGAFRDGVLRQFSGQEKSDGSLDLPGRECGFLVVS